MVLFNFYLPVLLDKNATPVPWNLFAAAAPSLLPRFNIKSSYVCWLLYCSNPAPEAKSFLGPVNACSLVGLGNSAIPSSLVLSNLGATSEAKGSPSYEYKSCNEDCLIPDTKLLPTTLGWAGLLG